MILFKLEGQKLLRHPEYGMADRLLLDACCDGAAAEKRGAGE